MLLCTTFVSYISCPVALFNPKLHPTPHICIPYPNGEARLIDLDGRVDLTYEPPTCEIANGPWSGERHS